MSGADRLAVWATSVMARYLMGSEACSFSQLSGKKSGSADGGVIGDASSGVVPGTVTGGAQNELEKARRTSRRMSRPFSAGRIAGFHLGASGGDVSLYSTICYPVLGISKTEVGSWQKHCLRLGVLIHASGATFAPKACIRTANSSQFDCTLPTLDFEMYQPNDSIRIRV